MPYKPGLGQGHNQKKDTHTLDFDVTLPTSLGIGFAFTRLVELGVEMLSLGHGGCYVYRSCFCPC
jgi:hypothetical protein